MKKKILLSVLIIFTGAFVYAQTSSIASGNWSDPSVWDNGVPGRSIDATINHDITLDKNAEVSDLTINSSGSFINSSYKISVFGNLVKADGGSYNESSNGKTWKRGPSSTISGKFTFRQLIVGLNANSYVCTVDDTLTINRYLNLTGGTLDVSGGHLVLNATPTLQSKIGNSVKGNIVGDYTWMLNIDRCNEWSTYCTAISGSLQDIASNSDVDGSGRRMIYTGFPGSDYPSFSFINTYFYDEVNEYQAPSDVTDNVGNSVGYWYWNSDEVFNSSEESIPQQWVIKVTGSAEISGTRNLAVSYGGTNWNLVGNPYAGVMDWDNGNWTKTNVDDALYYWNTCTQSYSSYVSGVSSNGGDRFISPGQGFFVETTGGSPSLTCNQKVIKTYNSSQLKTNETDYPVLKVTLNGDETILSFDENSTIEFDRGMDAKKLLAPSFVEGDMASVRTVHNGVNYSINTLPYEDAIIPLDVKGEGELSFTGANEFDGVNIYLEDKLTGDVVDMKVFQTYTFANDEKDFTDRFNVIVKKKSSEPEITVSEADLSVFPNPVSDRLNITSSKDFDRVDVYNTLGEIVLSINNNSNSSVLDMTSLNSGIYIVKVYNENNELGVMMTQKL